MIAEDAQNVQTERLAQQAASGLQPFQTISAQTQVRSDVIIVQKDEVEVSRRAILDFQTGTNTTLSVTDDPVGSRTLIKYNAPTAASNADHFVTTQSESDLTNEFSLGSLTTGILKHTVSGSVSTPATAVEGTDYYKPGGTDVAIADGGTNNSTAYTAGSVIVADGTKLTQDNANFFWDATNHRLGIGTATPGVKLDIKDTNTNTDVVSLILRSAGGAAGVGNGIAWYQTTTQVGGIRMKYTSGTTVDMHFDAYGGAGFTQDLMVLYGDGGLVIGSPTGGDKGAGTINAVSVYRNGTALDYVFEDDYDLMPLDGMIGYVRQHKHLPTIPTRQVNDNGTTDMGALTDRLWETVECQALYIGQLHQRLVILESKANPS